MDIKDILHAFGWGAYIVPAFYLGAAAAFFGALQAGVIGLFWRNSFLYISFAALCLNAAGILWSTGDYYAASSSAAAVQALRRNNDWTIFSQVFLYWFIALYSRQRTIWPWMVLMTGLASVLLVANHIQPGTMRFSAIESMQTLRFAWGESVQYLLGPISPWNVVMRMADALLILWASWRTFVHYQNGLHRSALFLAAYLGLQSLATVSGLLVDLGQIHTIYFYGVAILILAMLMGIGMRMDLRDSDEILRSILRTTLDGFLRLDRNGKVIDVNQTYCQLSGYAREELLGMRISQLRAVEDDAIVATHMQRVVETGRDQCETIHRRKDGLAWHVEVSATYSDVADGQFFVFVRDITKRKQAEEQIKTLAYFDTLTKLPNRRLLVDNLNRALIASNRTQEFGALMVLDLDNFKVINNTQGHEIGDLLLIEVAHRIVANMRQEDTAYRLGGDEFVVVLEGLGSDETLAASQAEKVAEKIRNAVAQPYVVPSNAQLFHSTPSIGVTLFQGQALAIDGLLKQADVALYQAKAAGRNAIRFFNPAMQTAIDTRSAMEEALRNGLRQNEFRLFYQPQIDQDGRLTGAEALLRWVPAGHAPVLPAQFIPLTEDIGLIVPLGLWVIQTACAQLKEWAVNPLTRGLHISVNVSARQFRQPEFFEQVRHSLEQHGANPALLKLELTESMLLENIEVVIGRMQQLKALGVTFSLDDFGTGFSSLSYLKRLPLDEVKIDQSFVRDIPSNPSDAAIVRAIIAMARSLGIHVIAEGVETTRQLKFLKDNGCMNYQGYLFDMPMSIVDWDRVLQDPDTTHKIVSNVA